MLKNFEIAIIGGGISGVTLAVGLHRRNIPCTLYERASQFGEIGAGVGLGPNAARALHILGEETHQAFEKAATHNKWESKNRIWFDFIDGTPHKGDTGDMETIFTLENVQGQTAVHRASFLDNMVKCLPEGLAHFKKHLDRIDKDEVTGKLQLRFHDGSTAEADAVIGCDGIKSRVREIIVGEEHPSAKCSYANWYAYRGLIPMEDAVKSLGEERAANACLWMGKDAHVLTFPIDHGKISNLFACCKDLKDWPDSVNLTQPATQEAALEDFKHFGPSVLKQIKMTKTNLERWALFDLGNHPVPTFYKDRVCISGDAAHATTPHHGAGAGLCIEDSAVLCSLLADECVKSPSDLQAVFASFDGNRRERGQWLVQSSRRAGELYEWRTEDVGNDFVKMEKELRERCERIWNIDLDKEIMDAKTDLRERLSRGEDNFDSSASMLKHGLF